MFVKQLGKLFGHGAAQLLGIHDGHGAAVVASHVVADADCDQLDRRARLDVFDHPAQVTFEVVARIDGERGIVDRGAIRDHHEDAALLGARQHPPVRPVERLAVDVLLEQPLAHHQPEVLACPPPGRVGRLVDDVAQVIETARIGRLAGGEPGFARLPALPGAGGKAKDFDLDAAALQRARKNVGARRRYRDRSAAHRARVVEQQRHHGVAELGILLALERQRMQRVDDNAREPRRIEQPLFEVELPGAILLGHQAALQPIGEPRDDALEIRELLVEIAAQPIELLGLAQFVGRHYLVELGDERPVIGAARLVDAGPAWAPPPGPAPRVRPLRLRPPFGAPAGASASPFSASSVISAASASAASAVVSDISSPETSASSTRASASSDCSPSPSSPDLSLRLSWSPSAPSSSSASELRSSPMSRSSSRSWTTSPKRAWLSISLSRRLRFLPARSSISGRHRSTSRLAAGGGIMPVSRSRTIMASAPSIGASARSETSSNLPRWKRSSIMADRFLATPVMRRAPIASTRACSTASNTARAVCPPGTSLRWTVGSWQASLSAIESACPRTIAASAVLSLRAGSGSRALPPTTPGRSAAKPTSRSGFFAIARMQPATARLNGSVGASFVVRFGLILEDIVQRFAPVMAGLGPAFHPPGKEDGCAGQTPRLTRFN